MHTHTCEKKHVCTHAIRQSAHLVHTAECSRRYSFKCGSGLVLCACMCASVCVCVCWVCERFTITIWRINRRRCNYEKVFIANIQGNIVLVCRCLSFSIHFQYLCPFVLYVWFGLKHWLESILPIRHCLLCRPVSA